MTLTNNRTRDFEANTPVIITGRGGSGTRLLSEIAQHLGVFLGNKINKSGDSLEWKDISREMLINDIKLKNGKFNHRWQKQIVNQAQAILINANIEQRKLWGWKLPESLFFLSEFLICFPNARIIHLVRNPLSLSLRRTHISSRMDNPVGQKVLPNAYRFLGLNPKDIVFQEDYFNNAVSWEYQMRLFLNDRIVQSLSDEQLLVMKYEHIVSDPVNAQSQLAIFLNLPQKPLNHRLNICRQRINLIRADDPRVDTVWSITGKTAMELGYSKKQILDSLT